VRSTARVGLLWVVLVFYFLGGVAGGCTDSGGIHIAIQLPDDALSPVMQNLARLELVAQVDGQPAQNLTRDVPAGPFGAPPIGFGELAIGQGVHLSLFGFSASGRLVGFGRAASTVDIKAGGSVQVRIPLRRPFAYVAGGSSLLACDTTVEPGSAFVAPLGAAAASRAVATTPDGNQLLTIGGDSLVILSTAQHKPSGAPATPVAPGATEIAVSPDSRWAVIVHAGSAAGAGVSIVNLATGSAPTFVAIDAAGGVAVANDIAWVLVNPSIAGPQACSQGSQLVPVTLATGAAGAPVSLAGAARDLALSSDGKTLFVAEPCQNAIVAVTGGGASQVKLIGMPGPTQVAVGESRVWGLGSDSSPSEHLVLDSVNADGSAASRLDIAATQELAKSNDLTEAGQVTEVRLDADQIEAYSMSVLPDGRNVVLLVHGTYHADEVVRPVEVGGVTFNQSIVPALDMETYEYQLVDVTTGVPTQRMRTSCNIDWDKGVALLDDWSCASAQGQVTASEDFVARQATVLYGAH